MKIDAYIRSEAIRICLAACKDLGPMTYTEIRALLIDNIPEIHSTADAVELQEHIRDALLLNGCINSPSEVQS